MPLPAPASETSPGELSVLQWNVFDHANATSIVEHLGELEAQHGLMSVICLQEVTTDSDRNPGVNVFDEITETLGLEGSFLPLHRDNGSVAGATGMALLWRGLERPVVRNHELSKGAFKGDKNSIRGYQELDIVLVGQRTVTVANTHLGTVTNGRAIRQKDAARITELATGRERYILTGDFNRRPYSKLVRHLGTRVLSNAFDDYSQPTWVLKSRGRKLFGVRADYMFVSHDLEDSVTSCEVLSPGPSDHCPILLRVRLV